jgi:hypothetical protein
VTKPDRSSLTPEEQRILDVTLDVSAEWEDAPRTRERAGALTAIGAIWTRLGWLSLGVDEACARARERMRTARWKR